MKMNYLKNNFEYLKRINFEKKNQKGKNVI